MSDSLGSLSSYALTIQQTQMSLIKANMQMQQQVVNILLESTDANVPVDGSKGCHVDVSL